MDKKIPDDQPACVIVRGRSHAQLICPRQAKRKLILTDLAPHVAESDSNAVMGYTMGIGGAGLEREACLQP